MSETRIDHKVSITLGEDERFVVPRRGERGYVRIDYVTVDFMDGHKPRVWAGGTITRKDGQIGVGWGRTSTSADLPDDAPWITRARRALRDSALYVKDVTPFVIDFDERQDDDGTD